MGAGGDDGALAEAFRRRALAAGLVCGALALAGLLVMRSSGLNLTHGFALVLVCVSAASGLATLLLCWWYRFGLARVTAALAVAAVVVGWAAGQAPRLLPGLTVVQAAASRSTLVALIIAVVVRRGGPGAVAGAAVHAVPAGATRHPGGRRGGRGRRPAGRMGERSALAGPACLRAAGGGAWRGRRPRASAVGDPGAGLGFDSCRGSGGGHGAAGVR